MNADGKIERVFFRKPIANKTTVMKSSAMDQSKKMKTLSQECFRRLHNTSDNVPESVKINILNEFMIDLKNSGYNENERVKILNAGIQTFRNLKTKESSGKRSFYRECDFKEEQKFP